MEIIENSTDETKSEIKRAKGAKEVKNKGDIAT